jgi:EmrB/QacA subfamily drug resistance transporter
MVYLDTTVVIVAFPALEASFPSATPAELSWVLSGYAVVFAALLLPAGRFGDRWGRRRAFLGGLLTFTAASCMCALSPTAWMLIGARLVQAAGGATLIPNAQALIMGSFPPERQAPAIGIYAGAAALAAALGPLLGGVVIEALSWRWIFLLNLPLGLAALRTAERNITERREDAAPLPDFAGAALAAGAVALPVLALSHAPQWGWGSPGVIAAFCSGPALALALAARSRRHPAPLVDPQLLRHRSIAAANAASLVFAIGFFALLFSAVLFMTTVWGYSEFQAGLALTPAPALAALVAAPAGRLAWSRGPRAAVVPGVALFAIGVGYAVAESGPEPDYVRDWLPAGVLAGVGVGMCAPTLNSAAVSALPGSSLSTGSGLNGMMRQVGAAFGIALAVALVGASAGVGDFRGIWLACVLAGLATGALAHWLPARLEFTPLEPPDR